MMTTLCTRCPTALIALLATGLLVVENAHAQGSVDSDFITLVTLYGATDGASWTYDDNWVSLEHPLGEWHGVTTDGSGRVTELRLGGNQLMGEIPSELGDLDALTGLYLDQNQLTGAIPSELGDLSNLQELYLYQNQLTGAIPSELGDLSNLQELYLYQNQLTGAIPSELGDLSNLQFLNLDRNQLTGAIPSELGNLSNLQRLHLYENELTGAIPSELGNLSNLQRLLLYENELTGAIPSELGNLSNLQFLYLFRNELSGAIPSELGNLSNLQRLHLYENELTGAIPSELGKLSNLLTLYLGDNELTGEIPPELGNLVSLTGLSLARNQLTGAIPSELGNLSNLQNLYLFSNEGLCVPPGSQLHTRLATIDFRGAVCAPPTVTSVVVASTPQSGDTYRLYETMLFTVSFSEPVELKPHGRLRLEVGLDDPDGVFGRTVEAVFSRITRSQYPTDDTPQIRRARHMHFEYKVQLFDRAEIGVSIGANALRLASGAQIRNEVGGAARLDHFSVGPLSDHKVDGSADVPMIEHISVVSTPRLRWPGSRTPDTYGEGENIRIGVRFDQPVHVEGEPTMALEVGDPCVSVCEARYESGSGTDTLVFAYLVLANEIDRNGIAISTNPVKVVYGESIRSATDYEADLSYTRTGTASGHKVDGSRQAAPHLSVEDAEAHEADGEMAFTVRLEPHGLGIVTVDYATRDGSGDKDAVAGLDYTETSGTLRFNPLETERTVTVPIMDDAHEDDGETFTLRLSNPDGAALRTDEREATGTIRNSDPEALSASFPASAFASSSHSGADDRPQAVVAFSEPVAAFAAETPSVSVTGGAVASVQPHAEDGLENAWVFFLVPDGGGDVTFALVADAACAAGGICTAGGTALTEVPAATTIPGPGGPAGPPLTASFEGAPEAHDGESAFTFRAAFSEPLSMMNGRRLREDVVAVSGGRATSAGRVDRRRDLWELTVEPDSRADVTVTVAAGAACGTPAAVCTKDGRALSETISATVEGPVNTAATVPRITAVQVTSVPELERDTYGLGETIRFTVSFSEQVEVTGRPHFTFSLGNRGATRRVDAPYESGSGTAALVFGYVVQEGDEDNNGIFLVDGDALGRAGPVALDAGEAIAALGGGVDADLSSSVRGTERDHKVDGSRAPAASAPMREDLAARACSALAGGDGLAPGRAAAALWRDGDMDSDQLAALDDMGNGNGTYDLGDLLAWINRCRPGSGSADGAGPPPSAPPAMPASQPAREASQRRKGARGPARRRRAAADPPTAGSRTRRSGWLRTALLAVVTLAWGCGDGIVGPRADTPGHDAVGAAFTDPGPLQVRLTAPPRARDIGAMLVIEGPAIDSVQAPGLEIFETDESSSMRREVVIAGALPPDAPVLRVWVPHRGDEARYRVSLLQVAAEDFTLGDPEDYAVAIGR